MTTSVEQLAQSLSEHQLLKSVDDLHKPELIKDTKVHSLTHQSTSHTTTTTTNTTTSMDKSKHPLHQFDLSSMKRFYESCVGKLREQQPKFRPTEWTTMNPMPHNVTLEQSNDWPNPFVVSQKQRVYEAFAKLARESGEPMVLMPNFDYGDIANFERFLQAMKHEGINAIGKYKQYLNNKDMRKFEVDLCVVHPRYGVLLIEVKECDHLDGKRRSRARTQLRAARDCFESMGRLVAEANGWTHAEGSVQVTEFIALPNVLERPSNPLPRHMQHHASNVLNASQLSQHDQSTASNVSMLSAVSGRPSRQLNYLIKSDLENSVEFAIWWTKYVVEPKDQQQKLAEAEGKVNKFDARTLNCLVGLINCVRNNAIMPVVHAEADCFEAEIKEDKKEERKEERRDEEEKKKEGDETKPRDEKDDERHEEKLDKEIRFQPALNVHCEFFQSEHEAVRSLSKVLMLSKDAEKLRKTLCMQLMWFLLTDSQKKISVVCSEENKAFYDEFFARQRKLYNNLNNVRFYSNLNSCIVEPCASHTLRKDGEIWFFDNGVTEKMSEVVTRIKELHSFWVFTTREEQLLTHKHELDGMGIKMTRLDAERKWSEQELTCMPWLTGSSIKFPLRLQCDLLIVGDLIGLNQLKPLYHYLKSTMVTNHANMYREEKSEHRHNHQYQSPQQQSKHQLSFNPMKKFRTVKFIRGGTIDNLRTSLKMHDSIQANVVLMHVGDEDIFKTRNSMTTIERVKELTTLVKEYCPKSFVVLSTLMKRMSRTENTVSNEVNKGITQFCKQTRDTLNCHFMLNSHFEPDYHTQEGRNLTSKGLRLYVENLLFVVDHYCYLKHKQ